MTGGADLVAVRDHLITYRDGGVSEAVTVPAMSMPGTIGYSRTTPPFGVIASASLKFTLEYATSIVTDPGGRNS